VLGSTFAEPLRTKVRGVTRSLQLPAAWRVGARTGMVGWAPLGWAPLVVAGGPMLLRAQRQAAPATVPANAPAHVISQEVRAMLPIAPVPADQSVPVAPTPDALARRTPSVLTPDDAPLLPVREVRSKPTKASKGRGRGRRHKPPVSSNTSAASATSSPMSAGMRRIGKLISQGADKQLPARSGGTS
jgi:hypothetical protein